VLSISRMRIGHVYFLLSAFLMKPGADNVGEDVRDHRDRTEGSCTVNHIAMQFLGFCQG
jgi:hypothetical protein